MTAPLSADEQARLQVIEWADPAPESIGERVAAAIHDADPHTHAWNCEWPCASKADAYRRAADAAIAVLRGPSVADEALRRVEELADYEEAFCEEQQAAEIRVAVPMKAGREFLDRIFEVIGDVACEAQPEDRDWDVFVSASMPETPQVPVHRIRAALNGGDR